MVGQILLVRGLLGILKDKGASVITARDRIQKEIDSRREIENIESRLGTMDLNEASSDQKVLQDKHIQYVCAKEKPTVNSKYRPYQSLTHSKANAEPTADASLEIAVTEKVVAVKSMKTTAVEVTAACEPKMVHEPAIVIPLGESLVIQDEQSHKLKVGFCSFVPFGFIGYGFIFRKNA